MGTIQIHEAPSGGPRTRLPDSRFCCTSPPLPKSVRCSGPVGGNPVPGKGRFPGRGVDSQCRRIGHGTGTERAVQHPIGSQIYWPAACPCQQRSSKGQKDHPRCCTSRVDQPDRRRGYCPCVGRSGNAGAVERHAAHSYPRPLSGAFSHGHCQKGSGWRGALWTRLSWAWQKVSQGMMAGCRPGYSAPTSRRFRSSAPR